ncbi:MAG: carboxyl transferase domain-containing protein, partial [Burkholderiaceae bacterium]
ETLLADGRTKASTGRLTRFELPSGPGIRVDTHGFAGAAPSPHFDTLLAKLIVQVPTDGDAGFAAAVRRSQRALAECRIEGVATNIALLRAIAATPAFASQQVHTRLLEQRLPQLLAAAEDLADAQPVNATESVAGNVDSESALPGFDSDIQPHWLPIRAPMAARVVQLDAAVGDVLASGASIAVVEAMKMQHLLLADAPGRVALLRAEPGQYVAEGDTLAWLEPVAQDAAPAADRTAHDLDAIRPDLRKVIDRHAFTLDQNRPRAINKRHAQGGRSARENIADLCDEGSFLEYGALAIAAQTARRSVADLIENTPADGMVTGTATINADAFGAEAARCAVMSYDYTVLAGTQGFRNHAKTDRLLALARQSKLPVVLFAEGGGGRPGDTDVAIVAGLHVHTFAAFAKLNGHVPVVGIVAGRCFAGNAALLGCCDAIIATANSQIGMGGPAMIEGGGLGTFAPEQIGPSNVQHGNGVIDVLVPDETAAVAAAKHYLSFFQGRTRDWQAADARQLRHLVPENRLRAYDTRLVMQALVDTDSLLPLRTGFGQGIHIALARIEGRPVGLIANNPLHLGGAIDADAADKAARFMQLCNAHGLAIVSLVDTPGFMVGPEIETKAQVRHVSRMFIAAAHLRVPCFAVVLRKGYGLGAMAMTAGSFHAPHFTVSWPTGEFGGMGLEGAVRLGYRKELEALPTGSERDALYDKLVAEHYQRGHAIHMAQTLEIDAVIDPAETRHWLARGLERAPVSTDAATRLVDVW